MIIIKIPKIKPRNSLAILAKTRKSYVFKHRTDKRNLETKRKLIKEQIV